MKAVGEEELLAFLQVGRRNLVQALIGSRRGYDNRDVRKLAELQGAIAAVESVLAETSE